MRNEQCRIVESRFGHVSSGQILEQFQQSVRIISDEVVEYETSITALVHVADALFVASMVHLRRLLPNGVHEDPVFRGVLSITYDRKGSRFDEYTNVESCETTETYMIFDIRKSMERRRDDGFEDCGCLDCVVPSC